MHVFSRSYATPPENGVADRRVALYACRDARCTPGVKMVDALLEDRGAYMATPPCTVEGVASLFFIFDAPHGRVVPIRGYQTPACLVVRALRGCTLPDCSGGRRLGRRSGGWVRPDGPGGGSQRGPGRVYGE